jgi:phage shock protein E
MKKILNILLLIVIITAMIACREEAKDMRYRKISAEVAHEMIEENDEIILIDVRTSDEFNTSHIPGSILVPYDVIKEQIGSIAEDKDTVIILYCRSGNRSKLASDALIAMGYSQVYDMGGITDWPYEITK